MKHHAIKFVCAHIHFIGVNLMSFSDTTCDASENLIPQTASISQYKRAHENRNAIEGIRTEIAVFFVAL